MWRNELRFNICNNEYGTQKEVYYKKKQKERKFNIVINMVNKRNVTKVKDNINFQIQYKFKYEKV